MRGRFILEKTCKFQLEGVGCKIVSAAHENGILVVGLNNGSFSLFSMNSLETIHAFKLTQSKINSLCMSKNGKWIGLASSEQQSLCVWQWSTESFIIKQTGFNASVVRFSVDGDIIATGGSEEGIIKLWRTENAFCFASFDEHQAPITDIAFMPKGNSIISASRDGTLRAFDLVKYRQFRKYEAPEHAQLQCLALDNSGQLVVGGAREPYSVFIWSVKTAELVDILSGHQAPISSLLFQPNSQMLVTCSWDKSLRVWDIFDKKSRVQPLQHSSELITFAFNPVQKNLLVSSTLNGDLNLWDVEEGELISVIQARRDIWGGRLKGDFNTAMNSTKNKHFSCVSYVPTGQFLIAGGNSRYLCIFQMKHRVLIQKISISSNRSLDGVLQKLNSKKNDEEGDDEEAYHSDLSDQQIEVIGEARRKQGQKIKRKSQVTVGVSSISFNPDASQFAVVTSQGVHIYSKIQEAAFIPYQFDSEVSVEQITASMESQNSAKAFIIACRLNEVQYIKHAFWKGIHKLNQETELIESIGQRDIIRALQFLSKEIQKSRNPEYVIRVTNQLLMRKAQMLKSLNKKGELNAHLFAIRRATQSFTGNYLSISDWNYQLLKFMSKKINIEREKSEGQK